MIPTRIPTRTEINQRFEELIDLIDSYLKQHPSRAGSIAKTDIETSRLWWHEQPPEPIATESD